MENRGMKWHKFLIYFSLWMGGILNTLLGALLLFVMMGDAPGKYRGETGLLLLLGVLAAGILACGIWCIVVRFRLAKFRQGAPAQLFWMLILSNLITGLFLMIDEGVMITSIIPGIVMAFINRYYYSKREDLFIR